MLAVKILIAIVLIGACGGYAVLMIRFEIRIVREMREHAKRQVALPRLPGPPLKSTLKVAGVILGTSTLIVAGFYGLRTL